MTTDDEKKIGCASKGIIIVQDTKMIASVTLMGFTRVI